METYPQPVSEYVEKTGPGTMVFLSYPKYYRDGRGGLQLTDTTLRPSEEPGWDYEVTKGIWSLRVRKDGTYQAEHKGNVFTYRLADFGIGRGDSFRSFGDEEANWEQYSVAGNTIRWKEVFPCVDFQMRYIQHLLKVDVIVQKNVLERVKENVRMGTVPAEEFLTARFEIPHFLITGEARQGNRIRDLYDEPLTLNQPLDIVKDEKIVQRIRPAESFLLNETGEPMYGDEYFVQSAQLWQLKEGNSGIAEISALLSDIPDKPIGDLLIDPSTTFDEGDGISDTRLRYNSDSPKYGSSSTLQLDMSGYNSTSDRIAIGFNISNQLKGKTIDSAKIKLYATNVHNATIVPYLVEDSWDEDDASWNYRSAIEYWQTAGGDFDTSKWFGRSKFVGTTGWNEFDVTNPFKKHFIDASSSVHGKGFILKYLGDGYESTIFYSSENGTNQPELVVKFAPAQYSVYASPPDANTTTTAARLQRAKDDKFGLVRYLCETSSNNFYPYVQQVANKSLNTFLHIPAHTIGYATTETIFKNYVMDHLDENTDDYVDNGTIICVELGGEEEGHRKWWESSNYPNEGFSVWYGNEIQGASFANYYLEARNAVKADFSNLEIMSGGAFFAHESMDFTSDSGYGNAGNFLRGYLARVIEAATLSGKSHYDLLPETISIHGYAQRKPPEGTVSGPDGNGKVMKQWVDRLDTLYDICSEKGYLPNFAVTEYGFSPTQNSNQYGSYLNGYAPDDPSETSMAVYYLRSCLMNSTMQPAAGIGWKYSSYFQHWKGAFWVQYNEWSDFGFHNDDTGDSGYGSFRAIKDIARKLFDPSATPALKLQDENTKIWVKAQYDLSTYSDKFAWCGWETGSGQKYGAIWRYQYGDRDEEGDRYWDRHYYTVASGNNRGFKVKGDLENMSTTLYRFGISSGSAQLNTYTGTVNANYSPGDDITTFNIPDVKENPTIIKFN